MNLISINTPVMVVNTGDSNVDGLTGRVTGMFANGYNYVIYIITLDKPLPCLWTTITMVDNCLEIIH